MSEPSCSDSRSRHSTSPSAIALVHRSMTRRISSDGSTRVSVLQRMDRSNQHGDRGLGQTVWSARRLARKLARVAVGIGPAVEPLLREAPVMSEGSWVGLDVHARSVVAGVIDQGSGEVRSLRLPPGCGETVAWLQTLPAPVRVVYEAGPTGYRLARACDGAGINCIVAAPSKIRAAA